MVKGALSPARMAITSTGLRNSVLNLAGTVSAIEGVAMLSARKDWEKQIRVNPEKRNKITNKVLFGALTK